jgi:hypothetical protein
MVSNPLVMLSLVYYLIVLASSKLKIYLINKFLQTRKSKLRQQSVNTKLLPQTQNGVLWKSGQSRDEPSQYIERGYQLKHGARGILSP